MIFTIWGGRGSYPKPLTQQQIRSKISAVLQRVQPHDIVSPEAKEVFLNNLPDWLFGTYSGNTACLSVESASGTQVVFDSGTGIVEYWQQQHKKRSTISGRCFHIFFSHYHYDHVQGFPFFVPAYIPGNTLNLYSPQPNLQETLKSQMRHPFFPITVDEKMLADLYYNQLEPRGSMLIGDIRISWRPLNHPGGAYGYLIESDNKRLMYCTDIDVSDEFYQRTKENEFFFSDLDTIILDTQYTLDEALQKHDWGHTSYVRGVDFAMHWNIKQLVMFHHEPAYDDQQLFRNQKAARDYARLMGKRSMQIQLAEEGVAVEI